MGTDLDERFILLDSPDFSFNERRKARDRLLGCLLIKILRKEEQRERERRRKYYKANRILN